MDLIITVFQDARTQMRFPRVWPTPFGPLPLEGADAFFIVGNNSSHATLPTQKLEGSGKYLIGVLRGFFSYPGYSVRDHRLYACTDGSSWPRCTQLKICDTILHIPGECDFVI